MSTRSNFNPQVVHDVAANLFWTLAQIISYQSANHEVRETGGKCLFEKHFSADILGGYGLSDLPVEVRTQFESAVAEEAVFCVANNISLDGVVYLEDREACRSPTATLIDVTALQVIPKSIDLNTPIQKLGELCLRHPLPAALFAREMPRSRVIEVADTTKALGFQMPMFMTEPEGKLIADGVYAIKGLLHIPVPSLEQGELWSCAVQNSVRFTTDAIFHSPDGVTHIQASW